MKRNLIFLTSFTLLLSACNFFTPQNEENEAVLTGGMSLSPFNAEGIPYCQDYPLKPLQTGNIIKIDDVVEKCTFYSGTNYYHTYSQ
ncbi:MAG: hypothetical protein Q4B28_05805 [bacterium]|nr:hypothetical protein [bacterium]